MPLPAPSRSERLYKLIEPRTAARDAAGKVGVRSC